MNYFEKCESIGDNLFIDWCNKTKYFSSIERQPLLSRVDWICKDNAGHVINCELKVRNTLKYNDILIEPDKYNYLMNKWNTEKIVPLYINLCGELVYAFDLRKCKVIDKGMIKIWSYPDNCYKLVHRFALLTKDAFKYINGEKQSN